MFVFLLRVFKIFWPVISFLLAAFLLVFQPLNEVVDSAADKMTLKFGVRSAIFQLFLTFMGGAVFMSVVTDYWIVFSIQNHNHPWYVKVLEWYTVIFGPYLLLLSIHLMRHASDRFYWNVEREHFEKSLD